MYKYTHSLFWCFALLLLPVFCISMNKTSGMRTSGGPVVVIYLYNLFENDEYIMHCLSNLLPCCPNLISPPPPPLSLFLSLSHTRFLLLLAVSSGRSLWTGCSSWLQLSLQSRLHSWCEFLWWSTPEEDVHLFSSLLVMSDSRLDIICHAWHFLI